ncbi:MAG: methionine--tRNA ligase, partial [Candidatus Aenigmarchaeota archaeon]|nr:methionine--tRNA ligase [Candidatus Aenigmarchaeota archaeon]
MIQIKFYITTAIIYTNAKPHIGFALELAQADAIARFHRIKGDDVFFLTGSDEHGIKNERAAKEAGLSTQAFVDKNTAAAVNLAKRLNISNDFYIRTSDKKTHYPTAQDVWSRLVKAKDIYKKKYTGLYCSGCEAFVKESDLVDGNCPIHNREPETVEEENYFFKLSKYQDKIIKLIESDKYLITPSSKKNEILNFIKGGLEDISFSRSKENLSWGIPVPDDPKQTIYVWCDALTNYLSGIGYTYDKKKFKKYWPADVHLVGKDITKFHAIYWPAMLLSAKIPLPKNL